MVPLITPVGPGGIHGVEGLVGRPVGHRTPMPGGACGGGGTDDHRPHTHAVSTVRSVAGTSPSLAARALSSTRQRSILLHSSRTTILSTTTSYTHHITLYIHATRPTSSSVAIRRCQIFTNSSSKTPRRRTDNVTVCLN